MLNHVNVRRFIPALVCASSAVAAIILGAVASTSLISLAALLAAVLLGGVLIARPQYSIHLTVLVAFTATPAAIPSLYNIAGIAVYAFEPALIVAVLWALTRPLNQSANRAVLTLTLVLIGGVLLGLASSAPTAPLNEDIRGLANLILAVFVASRTTLQLRQSIWTVTIVSQWVSAGLMLLASVTGLSLAGRAEAAALNNGESEATRLLTQASWLSIAILCGLLAVALAGRAQTRVLVLAGAPALIICFLGFSRNTFLGLAVAGLFVMLWSIRHRVAGRSSYRGFAGLAGLVTVLAGAYWLFRPAGDSWLQDQLMGYQERVLGGLSGSQISRDSSAQYRALEIAEMSRAFEDSPIYGHGFGYAYKAGYDEGGDFGRYTATSGRYYGHFYYLWIAVKTGLVGLVLVVGAFVHPVIRAFSQRSVTTLAMSSSLLGLLGISFVAPAPAGLPEALIVGGLIGGIWAALPSSRDAGVRRPSLTS